MFEFVIVLYNLAASESSTITSLNQLLTSTAFPEIKRILIFDNSSQAAVPKNLAPRFDYQHSPSNVGLAQAYNTALKQSAAETEWLVTLDQDTVITLEYLTELIRESRSLPESVVAIAPLIMDHQQQVSPVRSDTLRPLHNVLPAGDKLYSKDIMVINSATALRMDFLRKIGGYNLEFPLDYLDHWLSWRVFTEKKQVKILKATLQHQLSVLNYAEQMTVARYQAILQAEKSYYIFFQQTRLTDYRKHLFLRGVKQLVTGKFNYGKTTFKFLFLGGNNGDKSTKTNE